MPPPPPLFFASSPQGENAANLHTSLAQAGNESWIPVYLALLSGPAVRRNSCFLLSPPVARKVEIAFPPLLLATQIVYLGMADGRMGRTDKAADRPTDPRCRKMFQKSVTKWDWMGTLHNCGRPPLMAPPKASKGMPAVKKLRSFAPHRSSIWTFKAAAGAR